MPGADSGYGRRCVRNSNCTYSPLKILFFSWSLRSSVITLRFLKVFSPAHDINTGSKTEKSFRIRFHDPSLKESTDLPKLSIRPFPGMTNDGSVCPLRTTSSTSCTLEHLPLKARSRQLFHIWMN